MVDAAEGGVERAGAVPAPSAEDELAELRAGLESAGELTLEDRLELLQRSESAIARALEGLDGL